MNSIVEDFCVAWKTLDAELIIKHLDDSFSMIHNECYLNIRR